MLECNEDKYMTESHLSKYRTKIFLAIERKSKYSIYSFEGISNLETVRFLFLLFLFIVVVGIYIYIVVCF